MHADRPPKFTVPGVHVVKLSSLAGRPAGDKKVWVDRKEEPREPSSVSGGFRRIVESKCFQCTLATPTVRGLGVEGGDSQNASPRPGQLRGRHPGSQRQSGNPLLQAPSYKSLVHNHYHHHRCASRIRGLHEEQERGQNAQLEAKGENQGQGRRSRSRRPSTKLRSSQNT